MEFSLELATPADDPAIRRLLATNPVPGQIMTTYEREPDYFLGCPTMGHFWQVLVGRHRPDDHLAGVACRAARARFVNGRVEEVGYLSQLRVDRQFRGQGLVSLGFHFLRQLHNDGRVSGYLATIIEGSDRATNILVERPRRHFPRFQPAGRLWTMALILRKPKPIPTSSYKISPGSGVELAEIVGFLRQYGLNKQFFPAYTEADFSGSPATLDFRLEDFRLVRRGGKLVGVMGLWDQSGYKQTVVQSYKGALGRFRPAYNLGLRLLGAQPLPAPGQKIDYVYASFICVAENRPEVFDLLLRSIYNLAVERGHAYLMVGLMEGDPLLAVARRYMHIPYHSRLYVIDWDSGAGWASRLDDRPIYLEAATL